MINNKSKKDPSKSELAKLFYNISNPEEESQEKDLLFEKAKAEKQERFERYLEVTTIWFQSILGLKTSPSTGTADNRKMAGISMEKLVNKVNEFHQFISKNKKYLPFIPNKIDKYAKRIMNSRGALRILADFKNLANKNLEKLNLIMSNFKSFLHKIEAKNEGNEQDYLKIQDALLKLIILLHEPIKDVFSRFE
jgi:hypothetical protein